MARFYAKFDSGSSGWVGELDSVLSPYTGYFNRLRIHSGSSSAAPLRNGLISSRSALSADIYADLDAANRNGNVGTYFPFESSSGGGPFSTNQSTFVSWSSAFTSSLAGIKTPTTNSYGTSSIVNYSLRLTGSVPYTSSLFVTTSKPLDPVGASYTTYNSASTAVRTVLDTIQTGAGIALTPYIRTGSVPSRTVHSIWHDPRLNYFAWDDFTPGTGLNTGLSYLGNSPLTINVAVVSSQVQFANDWNPSGYIGFRVDLESTPTGPISLQLLANGAHTPAGGYIRIGTAYSNITGPANPTGGGNSDWDWDGVGTLNWQITLPAATYTVSAYSIFYDAITKFAGIAGAVTMDTKTVT